jgi:hypothetical protein
MPTWQFQSHLNPNQTVTLPPDVAARLTPDSTVQVVLMTGDSNEVR